METGWRARARVFVVQVIRFFFSTLTALVIDYGLYSLLCWAGLQPGWATLISSSTSTIVLYFLSTRLAFRSDDSLRRVIAFCLWYATSIIGFSIIVQLVHDLSGWNWLLSKLVTLPVSFSVNFLASRIILYRAPAARVSADPSKQEKSRDAVI